jgi:hypothetical protein
MLEKLQDVTGKWALSEELELACLVDPVAKGVSERAPVLLFGRSVLPTPRELVELLVAHVSKHLPLRDTAGMRNTPASTSAAQALLPSPSPSWI